MPVDTRGKGTAVVAASAAKGCICSVCMFGGGRGGGKGGRDEGSGFGIVGV